MSTTHSNPHTTCSSYWYDWEAADARRWSAKYYRWARREERLAAGFECQARYIREHPGWSTSSPERYEELAASARQQATKNRERAREAAARGRRYAAFAADKRAEIAALAAN